MAKYQKPFFISLCWCQIWADLLVRTLVTGSWSTVSRHRGWNDHIELGHMKQSALRGLSVLCEDICGRIWGLRWKFPLEERGIRLNYPVRTREIQRFSQIIVISPLLAQLALLYLALRWYLIHRLLSELHIYIGCSSIEYYPNGRWFEACWKPQNRNQETWHAKSPPLKKSAVILRNQRFFLWHKKIQRFFLWHKKIQRSNSERGLTTINLTADICHLPWALLSSTHPFCGIA